MQTGASSVVDKDIGRVTRSLLTVSVTKSFVHIYVAVRIIIIIIYFGASSLRIGGRY